MRFFERPGCHLCDEVRPTVERWAARLGFDLRSVDIEDDDDLVVRYGLRVPVLEDDAGRVVLEGTFGAAEIAVALIRARLRRRR